MLIIEDLWGKTQEAKARLKRKMTGEGKKEGSRAGRRQTESFRQGRGAGLGVYQAVNLLKISCLDNRTNHT